jgi:hypothetical protein
MEYPASAPGSRPHRTTVGLSSIFPDHPGDLETGSVALVIPRFPRLKEWAYAGVLFDLTSGLLLYDHPGTISGKGRLSAQISFRAGLCCYRSRCAQSQLVCRGRRILLAFSPLSG